MVPKCLKTLHFPTPKQTALSSLKEISNIRFDRGARARNPVVIAANIQLDRDEQMQAAASAGEREKQGYPQGRHHEQLPMQVLSTIESTVYL